MLQDLSVMDAGLLMLPLCLELRRGHLGRHLIPIKCVCFEAGGPAQQFRTLAALAEDPGLLPGTHMTAHNHL